MGRLRAVRVSSARFAERRYLQMLKDPLEDSGTLLYRAPDRLEKDTIEPKTERLVVEGGTVTMEHEGKTETLRLDDYPQLAAIIESIRATLAGDLPALQRIYAMRLDGTEADWQLVLQPLDAKLRETVQAIRISGNDVHIKRIETLEGDGDRTDMTITEAAP